MKFRNKIFVVVVLIVALFLLMPLLGHNRAKSSLESYRKQLVAKGEKLDIAQIAPHFTTEEKQAAHELLSSVTLLGSFSADWPPTMTAMTPGRAMVGWKEAELPTTESSNVWPGVRQRTSEHEEQLSALRDALKKPIPGFDLNYSEGPTLSINHLAPIRSGAIWLSKTTVVELHDGNPSEAWKNLTACVAMTRVCEREPLISSQLVRAAMAQTAISSAWEALQYPDWEESQLAELQSAWASIDFLSGLRCSLEMERATLSKSFEFGRRDYTNTVSFYAFGPAAPMDWGEAFANPKKGYETVMNRYPRYWAWKSHWSYEEEHFNTEVLQAALETTRKLQTNTVFAPALKELDAALVRLRQKHTNAVQKFLLGGNDGLVRRSVQKVGYMEMQRRLLITAIALKRYQLSHGKYPDELKELVPACLAAIPLDPMDGNPLRYQPKTDGTFLLYSVGEDGVDDGGDATPAKSSSGNFQWFTGRDAVWPMPAGPEEVAAYKQKVLAQLAAKQASGGNPPLFNPATLPRPAKTN